MNDRLPQLLETVEREGFRVHQWTQVARGRSWICTLQYPSKRYEHTMFSGQGQGKSAALALESALAEVRPLMKKHGVAPASVDTSIEDLLG